MALLAFRSALFLTGTAPISRVVGIRRHSERLGASPRASIALGDLRRYLAPRSPKLEALLSRAYSESTQLRRIATLGPVYQTPYASMGSPNEGWLMVLDWSWLEAGMFAVPQVLD